jgi:hypothetical protein
VDSITLEPEQKEKALDGAQLKKEDQGNFEAAQKA